MNINLRNAILKATDPKLRTDNWQYIIGTCDIVKEDPEDNGKEAIELIEKRLEQTDANVILRTLSLIVSLAENCGSRLKQLISSKKLTAILFTLIEKQNIHITVKKEVAKVVSQLADSFKKDPSLKSMKDLHKKIKKVAPYLYEKPDSLPPKTQMSSSSKDSEEKELEEALRLSLTEYEKQQQQHQVERSTQNISMDSSQQSANTSAQNQSSQPQSNYYYSTEQQQQPTIVRKVRALYDLAGSGSDELSFKKGDVIMVLEQVYKDWWKGKLRDQTGIFPLNYVTPVPEPTSEELRLGNERIASLLQQKRTVDQLHSTLKMNNSTASPTAIIQNQEVNDVYSSVTPLRPQITRMIGSLAQEKDDLNSLREILANAESTYSKLLDNAANTYKPFVTPSAYQPSAPLYQGNATFGSSNTNYLSNGSGPQIQLQNGMAYSQAPQPQQPQAQTNPQQTLYQAPPF
ncbi:ESCRT-0 subunit protein HSE1 NDAI_0K02130 [Naumovozyma dairenensis CBS 421]|uniref:Class E vacuolar protein-sorting machinery protein HSE1 n=1 Tax=Naumovozyma dairenensis (strain ATCC 10597 / BCRC 20456 / CBS 421 / NBRC 0211 / NRRL Y-12639) TaxID=1071378 RepID=G0WHZ3_NAUDC|nr:hypothetical protein NDAI_0K02130 [Naumovozyma dairenensis CBS 421]CCD27404.1 hypothetical protein NDAI_0K02130 [Naumovozyma dairenensis CBS 421]